MTGPSIGERQRLDRALAKSPIVKAVLEQERLEALEARRAAIARKSSAEARYVNCEASRDERLQVLEREVAPIRAKFEAAQKKLETGRTLLDQELGIARLELYAAERALRELPRLQRFEEWRERMSRAMQLGSPNGEARPKPEQFRSDRAFQEALEAWNAKALARSEQLHEMARMVRSTMNMAPLLCESDEAAIELCERALRPLREFLTLGRIPDAP